MDYFKSITGSVGGLISMLFGNSTSFISSNFKTIAVGIFVAIFINMIGKK